MMSSTVKTLLAIVCCAFKVAFATPLPVNGGWHTFCLDGPGSPARENCIINEGVGLAGNTMTFSSRDPVYIQVTDAFIAGESFDVYINGLPFSTPDVPIRGAYNVFNPDSAFADPRYSKGSWLLPAGAYSVDIFARRTLSPGVNGGGAAYVRVTTTAQPSSNITIEKNGPGTGRVVNKTNTVSIDCGASCSASAATGTKVVLEAIPDPGSVFIGWSESGCVSSKPCFTVLDSSKTIVATFARAQLSQSAKTIFVGVCGYGGLFAGNCVGQPGWNDPRNAFPGYNPLNISDLNQIAFEFTGIGAIGARIAAQYPNSITMTVAFSGITTYIDVFDIFKAIALNARSVAVFVEEVYSPGDKVYLVGHSYGGAVIQEAAHILRKKKIPVEMTAQIDSIGVDGSVSNNVGRAFNFYTPRSECASWGETSIVSTAKKDTVQTIVSNEAIANPEGPDSGPCGPHRNMDNDPRVWRPILFFMNG